MPVGEVPITSYFTRVPQKKKRKENPHTKSAPAKRKRVHDDEVEDGEPPKKEPKIQASLTFPKLPKDSLNLSTSRRSPPYACGEKTRSRHTPSLHVTTPSSPTRIVPHAKGKSVAFASFSCAPARNAPEKAPDAMRETTWGEPPDEDDVSSFIVPSSQSQYISSTSPSLPDRVGSLFTPGSPSPRRWNESPNIDIVPSSQSQYFPAPPAPVERDDDGFVVPSSQSQWLLPLHLDGDDDSRPNSSPTSLPSQFELELIPRKGGSYRESSHVSCQSPKPSVQPDRIDVEDMFEDPLVATTDNALDASRADSETESDDDFPPPPRTIDPPIRPPSPEQEEYSEPVDDGCGSSAASSLGSLPAAVKDFYDMFGSGDSSYPDDFPESLKWRGGETQD
ncbi:hypothetical protein B0H17DRAFT_1068749 [Mycena rosella]|uniref:Uncharacterized protein n=1 Tax=Mycena rosella TaxID=1033263 RepID=A0AAD7DD10_MYCRO|nr:hypothetical protein B0H17DRAFT_1068749 [Mycena rosella]